MSMTMDTNYDAPRNTITKSDMPVPVQVLSTLLFAGFAFVTTIVALNIFWPAGFALAVILAWRGGFAPNMGNNANKKEIQRLNSLYREIRSVSSD
jgi:hypothetical protein